LLRELELYQRAGLTPYEALFTATAGAAQQLGIGEEVGEIAVGYAADLLLLDQDPTERFDTLDDPAGVLLRGRWLDREALQAIWARL
jgi:imidazolonepropionase-like amidohydrolase